MRPLHPLQTFLQQHGTLEALLAAAPAMKKSKVRDALISYGDSALSQRSKAAVVLGLQSELESRADELVGAVPPPPAERPELREFLQRHEFASLERKLFGRAARCLRHCMSRCEHKVVGCPVRVAPRPRVLHPGACRQPPERSLQSCQPRR